MGKYLCCLIVSPCFIVSLRILFELLLCEERWCFPPQALVVLKDCSVTRIWINQQLAVGHASGQVVGVPSAHDHRLPQMQVA